MIRHFIVTSKMRLVSWALFKCKKLVIFLSRRYFKEQLQLHRGLVQKAWPHFVMNERNIDDDRTEDGQTYIEILKLRIVQDGRQYKIDCSDDDQYRDQDENLVWSGQLWFLNSQIDDCGYCDCMKDPQCKA